MDKYSRCANKLLQLFEEEQTKANIKVTSFFCRNHPLLVSGAMLDSANTTRNLRSLCCVDVTKQRICQETLKAFKYNVTSLCPGADGVYIDPLSDYDTATYILLSLLVPLGLIGNLLILFAIIRLRCLPRQTGNFLGSLACADIGVLMQYFFWFVFNKTEVRFSDNVNQFLMPSIDIFFAAISLLQITTISIERAVAVTWPLKYPSYISSRRSKVIVYTIWVLGAFFFLFSMSRILIPSESYTNIVFYITAGLLLFLPLIIIVVSYTMVLVCAYKNLSQDRKRLRTLMMFIRSSRQRHSNNNSSSTSEPSANKNTLNKRNSTIRCREIKLAVNVAMVVIPFLGCWGFFLFIHLYELLIGYHFENIINWLVPTLPFIVSSLNPILYLVLTRSLRKSVKSLIKRKVKARLSRTEVSLLTLATNTATIGNAASTYNNNNDRKISDGGTRKFGRDSTKDMASLEELVQKLSNE